MSGKLKNTRAAVGHQTDSGVKLKHSSGGKRSCSAEAWSYNSKHRFPSSFMSQRCCQTSLLVSVGGACRCTSACWLDASALKVCEKFRVRWCNACSRVLLRDKVRWKLLGFATLLPSAGLFLFEDKPGQTLPASHCWTSEVLFSTDAGHESLLQHLENMNHFIGAERKLDSFLAQSDSKWASDPTADWSLSGALTGSNKRI